MSFYAAYPHTTNTNEFCFLSVRKVNNCRNLCLNISSNENSNRYIILCSNRGKPQNCNNLTHKIPLHHVEKAIKLSTINLGCILIKS